MVSRLVPDFEGYTSGVQKLTKIEESASVSEWDEEHQISGRRRDEALQFSVWATNISSRSLLLGWAVLSPGDFRQDGQHQELLLCDSSYVIAHDGLGIEMRAKDVLQEDQRLEVDEIKAAVIVSAV